MVLAFTLFLAQATQSVSTPWSVNTNHALIWDGKPHLPVGVRLSYQEDGIRGAKSAGITDLWIDGAVDIPSVQAARKLLDAEGLRYIYAFDHRLPSATGFAVEPESYRLGPVQGKVEFSSSLPGARRALVALADMRTGDPVKTALVPVTDGQLSVTMVAPDDLEYVLLVFPELVDGGMPDLWDGLDRHRDHLLKVSESLKGSAGLRGIANPLGRIVEFPSFETRFTPTGDAARVEFEAYLRAKYRTLDSALRSWAITGVDFSSFSELVKLVPLWSGTRGISQFLHAENGQLYKATSRQSTYWNDLGAFVRNTAHRRAARMAALLKAELGVPVLQEWCGWDGPRSMPNGISGVGWPLVGTSPVEWYRASGPGAGAALRASEAWSVASDIRVPVDQLSAALDEAASLGARAWFVSIKKPEELAAIATQAKRLSSDASYSEWKPTPVFFPESATNPASTSRVVGGLWWLPDNIAGTRLDLGNLWSGYRIDIPGASTVILWSGQTNRRVKFRSAEPKAITVRNLDGSEPRMKIVKGGFEIDLGAGPVEIKTPGPVPIPEEAIAETVTEIQAMIRRIEDRAGLADQERYVMQEILPAIDRSPAEGLATLRQQLRRIQASISYWIWVEAETTNTHNFSNAVVDSGMSNGRGIAVRCLLEPLGGVFSASYSISPRRIGKHDVWVAARVQPSDLAKITVMIAGLRLKATEPPVSFYGKGFAWYRFGEVELPRETMTVTVTAEGKRGLEMALDALVLSPSGFRPNGLALPSVDND
ncbi:MAG: hypothetical protein HONBIEJF_00257 [Fimbriimonadaceae bacterium]|nr:hypothetical protein [Fimbriimonadaceae bacterium]